MFSSILECSNTFHNLLLVSVQFLIVLEYSSDFYRVPLLSRTLYYILQNVKYSIQQGHIPPILHGAAAAIYSSICHCFLDHVALDQLKNKLNGARKRTAVPFSDETENVINVLILTFCNYHLCLRETDDVVYG